MKRAFYCFSILLALASCNSKHSEQNSSTKSSEKNEETNMPVVTNIFNGPTTITSGSETFTLSWSAHPSAEYYKEEFSINHEDAAVYTRLLLLELSLGRVTAEDARAGKIRELEARQAEDKLASFELPPNQVDNETLVSFMLSEGVGKDKVVEWNCYRYSNYNTAEGAEGIYLFGLSRRGYGKDADAFVEDIKLNKQKYINDFVAVKKPVIAVN